MPTEDEKLRVAAMADIHYSKNSAGALQQVFVQVTRDADVLLLCGDLTDYGLAEEAHILARDLDAMVKTTPVLAVLGNHDFESGQEAEVRQILADAGVVMLDGETSEVKGVGFAGVKGFGGGFGQYLVTPWGEEALKGFVRAAVEEGLKLETALSRLSTGQRVAVLHYAPIRQTVEGESPEIYPFAGCSRLEDPLDHFQVCAAFHGHAHHGSPEGQTRGGVPVYNVAVPVLKKAYPDRPPYRVIEILIAGRMPETAAPTGAAGPGRNGNQQQLEENQGTTVIM